MQQPDYPLNLCGFCAELKEGSTDFEPEFRGLSNSLDVFLAAKERQVRSDLLDLRIRQI